MIFDSPRIQKIREKYKRGSLSSGILEIDQYPELEGEKAYIEGLIGAASSSKQKDWCHRLLSEDDETHTGAWFEVMLYGWLKEIGFVEIEPEIERNKPDFSLDIHGIKIIIEAKACLLSERERNKRKYKKETWKVLSKIKQPYYIFIRKAEFNFALDRGKLKTDVEDWLVTNPDKSSRFRFRDEKGNILILEAEKEESLCVVAMGGDPNYGRNHSKQLKKTLSKKANQHQSIRKAGYPYIIALFLEDYDFSAEEVAEAWFGNLQMVLDHDNDLRIRFSGRGKQFSGEQIQHKDISGTLIFKSDEDFARKRRYLKSWYIENPFASVPIDRKIFPVESRLVHEEQNMTVYMRWVKEENGI